MAFMLCLGWLSSSGVANQAGLIKASNPKAPVPHLFPSFSEKPAFDSFSPTRPTASALPAMGDGASDSPAPSMGYGSSDSPEIGDGGMILRLMTLIQYSPLAKRAIALGEKLLQSPSADQGPHQVIDADGKKYFVKFIDGNLELTPEETLKIPLENVIPGALSQGASENQKGFPFEKKIRLVMKRGAANQQLELQDDEGRNIPSLIKDYLTTLLPKHRQTIARDYEAFRDRAKSESLYAITIPSRENPNPTSEEAPSKKRSPFEPQAAGFFLR